jgi:S1-C subfamily serine protease
MAATPKRPAIHRRPHNLNRGWDIMSEALNHHARGKGAAHRWNLNRGRPSYWKHGALAIASTLLAQVALPISMPMNLAQAADDVQSISQQSIGEAALPPANAVLTHEAAPPDIHQIDGLRGDTLTRALGKHYGDRTSFTTRGKHDAEIYKSASPGVVIVLTDTGIGSGSFIGANRILTNYHVVKDAHKVGVIFKPKEEGETITRDGVLVAQVIKQDPMHDLALLQFAAPPPSGLKPVVFATEADIQIGADVHAIGHPIGETWTYTKGIISQYRKNYDWKDINGNHNADVIQTQTPINPGNSGGPLLTDDGKLLGVNSFKTTGGENLNFALSIVEVEKFLKTEPAIATATSPTPKVVALRPDTLQGAPPKSNAGGSTGCEIVKLYAGRDRDNKSAIELYDANCDGKADITFELPDDVSKPMLAMIDSNFDGKNDIRVESKSRNALWNISFHDTNFDGTIDMIGRHADGKIEPTSYEPYFSSIKY